VITLSSPTGPVPSFLVSDTMQHGNGHIDTKNVVKSQNLPLCKAWGECSLVPRHPDLLVCVEKIGVPGDEARENVRVHYRSDRSTKFHIVTPYNIRYRIMQAYAYPTRF
jgi:hypothetical protein